MTEFIIYQGKAAIVLAVFYMFYRLLLSKETIHRFNRIVLLGTAALSFILPLCVITINEVVTLPSSLKLPPSKRQASSEMLSSRHRRNHGGPWHYAQCWLPAPLSY